MLRFPYIRSTNIMAHNRPVHFEIHAENPERAAAFYAAVFGWEVKKWDMPGMEYWAVMTGKAEEGDKWPGIDGGLLLRQGSAPVEGQAVNGYVCTMTVEHIDAAITKILAANGTEAAPKNPIPGMGWLAYFKDTEGNIFGVMQEDPSAK